MPDPSRPDGVAHKFLFLSLLGSLGWQPRIALQEGLRETFDLFRTHA